MLELRRTRACPNYRGADIKAITTLRFRYPTRFDNHQAFDELENCVGIERLI